MRYRAWAMVGALGGVLLAGRAHAQCSKDTECKGERVCEQGQCVTPKPDEALPPPPPPPAAPSSAPTEGTAPAAAPALSPRPLPNEDPTADEQQKPREYHRRSPGLMITGIVLTSGALPFLVLGASLSNTAYNECIRDLPDAGGLSQVSNDCRDARETRGYAILGVTIAMLGVGIPLIVYGAKKVPGAAQVTFTPWVSPTAAGATLRLAL